MKQALSLIWLLPTYLLLNLQVVLQVHTCQIKGTEVRLYASTEDGCCYWEEEEALPAGAHCRLQAPDCCETEQISLQLDQPQEVVPAFSLQSLMATLPPEAPVQETVVPEAGQPDWTGDLPPPKVALWRQYCAALTYG